MASTLRFDNWENSNGVGLFNTAIQSESGLASYEIDFSASNSLIDITINSDEDLTFTGANYVTGKVVTIRVYNGYSIVKSVFFPANWRFVTPRAQFIEPSKFGLLSLTCFGNTDSDCMASWAAEY